MRVGLSNVLSAASLLAALGVALLWVRSYVVHDTLRVRGGRGGVGIHSTGGQVAVVDDAALAVRSGPAVRWQREQEVVPYGAPVRLALVRFEVGRFGNGRLFVFPHWPVVAAAALPPAAVVFRRRRRGGRAAGAACGRCGYDLTGNVSGVCPECGTAR